MTVEAIDSGDPRLSSQATIIVNILDENDNPPIFKRRKYQGFMNSDLSDFRNDLQVSFQNINVENIVDSHSSGVENLQIIDNMRKSYLVN